MDLNAEQKRIATQDPRGHQLLKGVAGSGKTSVGLYRAYFLLNNYCRSINYDYTHQYIHYGWNSCGGYKKVVNGEIFSHNIPEKHKVHVLHYWDVFKPWITQCPIYNKLEHDYKQFERILPQIQFNNIEKVLEIYTDTKNDVRLYT